MASIKQVLKNFFWKLRAWRIWLKKTNQDNIKAFDRKSYNLWHPTALIEPPYIISNPRLISVHEYTKVRRGFEFIGNKGTFELKKYSTIAMNCTVVTDNHYPTVGVPQILSGGNHLNDVSKDIIINEGVWIGINCTLLPGAIIGRGCIIGACSMVNKEIPPYGLAVGSPAKVIASVFTIDQIIKHEKILYPENERFTREYLESLFRKYYNDKKSIGIDNMTPEQKDYIQSQLNDRMRYGLPIQPMK